MRMANPLSFAILIAPFGRMDSASPKVLPKIFNNLGWREVEKQNMVQGVLPCVDFNLIPRLILELWKTALRINVMSVGVILASTLAFLSHGLLLNWKCAAIGWKDRIRILATYLMKSSQPTVSNSIPLRRILYTNRDFMPPEPCMP